ncbi:MAG: hypothetical protein K2X27_21600 [Candidatus Obscuribacterales bacterium]|nr:hypothetical protein [Candidatus Obscuribacterales bacterium]
MEKLENLENTKQEENTNSFDSLQLLSDLKINSEKNKDTNHLPGLSLDFGSASENSSGKEEKGSVKEVEGKSCLLPVDQGTPELKAIKAIIGGKPEELKEVLDKLRKSGDDDAEGKLLKSIKEKTGVSISYNGKELTMSVLTTNTQDFKAGVSLKVDAAGKVTASKFTESFGAQESKPADVKEVKAQIRGQSRKHLDEKSEK